MKSIRTLLVIGVLLLLAGAYLWKGPHTTSVSKQASMTVRIGHLQGALINLPEDILRTSDLSTKKEIVYEFKNFASSNLLYEAVVRGDVDLTGEVSALPVFLNNNKQPGVVKIYGATNIDVPDKFDFILVRTDSPFKRLQDLSGKKIKYGVFPGTTLTAFTKKYLENLGIDNRQFEFIQIPPQNHISSLESGAIDVVGTYDPMATTGLAKGNIRVLDYSVIAHVYDHTPLGVALVNSAFLAAHPTEARLAMHGVQEGFNLMRRDPENAYRVLAEVHKLPPEITKRISLPFYAIQTNVSADAIQKLADYLYEIKEIPEKVDVSSFYVNLQ